MIISVTGHTNGLGKDIYKHFQKKCLVKGYSRSNGYDISLPSDRIKIIHDSKDCDIFINNAYSEFSQIELLYGLYEFWCFEKKKIINISSNSPDGIKNKVHKYAIHKAALDKASEQLSNQYLKNKQGLIQFCKVSNIKPGWLDVPRIYKDQEKINTKEIINIIELIIASNNLISEVKILP